MEGKTHSSKHNIHKILAHSYFLYFLFFVVGLYLDIFFNPKVFINSALMPAGFLLLIFGTLLILWAQKTSRNLQKENITSATFRNGPYFYTRTPTHWGLFFLTLGFGMIMNAFFVILSALISLVISRLVFLDKEEKVLAEKYGTPYLEYKKIVKF